MTSKLEQLKHKMWENQLRDDDLIALKCIGGCGRVKWVELEDKGEVFQCEQCVKLPQVPEAPDHHLQRAREISQQLEPLDLYPDEDGEDYDDDYYPEED